MMPRRLLRRGAALFLSSAAAAARLLPWRGAVLFGGFIGLAAFSFLPGLRRRSEKSTGRATRESFIDTGRSFAEIVKMWSVRGEEVEDRVIVEGEEVLKKGVGSGHGVVLVASQVGNWELMGAILSRRGYLVHLLFPPFCDPQLDGWVKRSRDRFKVRTVSRGIPVGSRRLLTILRRGEVVGLLLDPEEHLRAEGMEGRRGGRAQTPRGAAELALRAGAQIVAVSISRWGIDRHRVVLSAISLLEPDPEQGGRRITAHLLAETEGKN